MIHISRRSFLGHTAVVAGTAIAAQSGLSKLAAAEAAQEPDLPLIDYHAHLGGEVTLERALAISRRRGVKFGIVEHAGTKANKYPNLLSNDDDLKAYLAMLAGKPVFRGIQAEGLDWMTCFSKEVVAQLDYVLSDALTFPEKDGHRVELWKPGLKFDDPQDFMDRYTDFNVQVISREPIDILANPTYLPPQLAPDYDTLWTPARMQRIIDAAIECGVAIEISSWAKLPSLAMLRLAKRAGAKFSFGSNIHGLDVGNIDYGLRMAKELGLKRADLFTPAPPGKKPIERRRLAA
jgi:histidinol phosphatase-like PHP family hydrolase